MVLFIYGSLGELLDSHPGQFLVEIGVVELAHDLEEIGQTPDMYWVGSSVGVKKLGSQQLQRLRVELKFVEQDHFRERILDSLDQPQIRFLVLFLLPEDMDELDSSGFLGIQLELLLTRVFKNLWDYVNLVLIFGMSRDILRGVCLVTCHYTQQPTQEPGIGYPIDFRFQEQFDLLEEMVNSVVLLLEFFKFILNYQSDILFHHWLIQNFFYQLLDQSYLSCPDIF